MTTRHMQRSNVQVGLHNPKAEERSCVVNPFVLESTVIRNRYGVIFHELLTILLPRCGVWFLYVYVSQLGPELN